MMDDGMNLTAFDGEVFLTRADALLVRKEMMDAAMMIRGLPPMHPEFERQHNGFYLVAEPWSGPILDPSGAVIATASFSAGERVLFYWRDTYVPPVLNELERFAEAIRKGDDPLAVVTVAVRQALREGFRAGFESTTESFNAEYPGEAGEWETTSGGKECQQWVDGGYVVELLP